MLTKLFVLVVAQFFVLGTVFADGNWEKWKEVLFIYGPMAAMLCWGAWMAHKLLTMVFTKIDAHFTEISTELRILGHRLNGMSKALFAEALKNETLSPAMRNYVERELEKLQNESEVADIRARYRAPTANNR